MPADPRSAGVTIPIGPAMGLGEGTATARPVPQHCDFVNGMPGPFPKDAKGMSPPGRVPAPTYEPPPSLATAAPWEKHDPKWGAGGVAKAGQRANPPPGAKPPKQPAWLAFDSVQLHFGGYFEDLDVTARTGERRVRRCVITYHLEDGSIDIREPRGSNSGLEQGRILHRMRVFKPDGSGPMTPADLNVGEVPVIYKREYHVLACDEFTRAFLEREGVAVPAELPFPSARDPTPPKGQFASAPSIVKAEAAAFSTRDANVVLPAPANDLTSQPAVPGSLSAAAEALKESAGRQFLELDGRVLRFFATAESGAAVKNGDDTRTDGTPRAYAVHYFLADDTVEVLEVLPAGVDDYSKVLKRQRLPKPSAAAGGGFGVGIRPASQDTIRRGGVAGRVDWRDLRVGGEVNVFGKVLTLRDCDESTKRWYVSELGVDEAMFAPVPAPAPPARASRAEPPPNVSGIGSDADSLQYCLRLVPKPQPTKDFSSWAANNGQVLRFTATFVSDTRREVDEIDKMRAFVVSYFLEDNTVSVYEPPVPNSGLPGGPFFKRQAARKSRASSAYLRARDCVVGAVIEISGRSLRLNGADDATFALMEARRDTEFPKSDFAKVAADAAAAVRAGGAAARAALRRAAAAEDLKLFGGGAMVLDRNAFIEVLTCDAFGAAVASASPKASPLDAQSLVTLWRGLPKKTLDPNRTRAPGAARRRAAPDAEYVDVEALFALLAVPWEEGRSDAHAQ